MFVFRFMLWLYKICFQVAWWLLKVMVKAIFVIGGLICYGIICLICLLLKKPLPQLPDTLEKKHKPMTGLEFEHHCAELLMRKGFKEVIVTPPSGDYGADLIAFDKTGSKWVFQCKHYKGKVNNSAVQEIVAAKAHYRADKAAVMTNSKLTEQARQLAFENAIELFEMLSD